jgi:hypothetical protein
MGTVGAGKMEFGWIRRLRCGDQPTDAITRGHGFELAPLNATNLVMCKEDMVPRVSALRVAK